MPAKIVFVGGDTSVEVKQDVEDVLAAIRADDFAALDLRSGSRRVYVSRAAVAYVEESASREGHSF